MLNTNYFSQLSRVKVLKHLSEETLLDELERLYDYLFPLNIKSRNLKIRLIQARMICENGTCLLTYDELHQVIVDGVSLPVAAVG